MYVHVPVLLTQEQPHIGQHLRSVSRLSRSGWLHQPGLVEGPAHSWRGSSLAGPRPASHGPAEDEGDSGQHGPPPNPP